MSARTGDVRSLECEKVHCNFNVCASVHKSSRHKGLFRTCRVIEKKRKKQHRSSAPVLPSSQGMYYHRVWVGVQLSLTSESKPGAQKPTPELELGNQKLEGRDGGLQGAGWEFSFRIRCKKHLGKFGLQHAHAEAIKHNHSVLDTNPLNQPFKTLVTRFTIAAHAGSH